MENNCLVSKSCHVENGELVMCSGLAAVTESNCRKGIKSQLMMNFKTGKEWYICVAHSGDYVKNGLVMNWCPFCGKDILSHTPLKEKAK